MLAGNGFQDLSSQLSKEAFLALFCQEFEDLLDVLKADGFLPLRDKYTSMWMHTGQTVQVSRLVYFSLPNAPSSYRKSTCICNSWM
jgi:biotin-(acetyl-CoA carboxylase) ligase